MDSADRNTGGLKEKARHELIEYGFNVIYLTLVFAAFIEYRRLILAVHDIAYENYWVALFEAVVLGKVIMLGSMFPLGRGLGGKPLILPTIYKTIAFCVLVAVFKVIEHTIMGLWNGQGLVGGLMEFVEKGPYEVFANSLVVFVALIPFFAFKELGRVLGRKMLWTLFFRRKTNL